MSVSATPGAAGILIKVKLSIFQTLFIAYYLLILLMEIKIFKDKQQHSRQVGRQTVQFSQISSSGSQNNGWEILDSAETRKNIVYTDSIQITAIGKKLAGNQLSYIQCTFCGRLLKDANQNQPGHAITCKHPVFHQSGCSSHRYQLTKLKYLSLKQKGQFYLPDQYKGLFLAIKKHYQDYFKALRQFQQYTNQEDLCNEQILSLILKFSLLDWTVLIVKNSVQRRLRQPDRNEHESEGQILPQPRNEENALIQYAWVQETCKNSKKKVLKKFPQKISGKKIFKDPSQIFQIEMEHSGESQKGKSGAPYVYEGSTQPAGIYCGFIKCFNLGINLGIGLKLTKQIMGSKTRLLAQLKAELKKAQQQIQTTNPIPSLPFYETTFLIGQISGPVVQIIAIRKEGQKYQYVKFSNGILLNQSFVLIVLRAIFRQEDIQFKNIPTEVRMKTCSKEFQLNIQTLPNRIDAFKSYKLKYQEQKQKHKIDQNLVENALKDFAIHDILILKLKENIKQQPRLKFSQFKLQKNGQHSLLAYDHKINTEKRQLCVSHFSLTQEIETVAFTESTIPKDKIKVQKQISPFKQGAPILQKGANDSFQAVGAYLGNFQGKLMAATFNLPFIKLIQSGQFNREYNRAENFKIQEMHSLEDQSKVIEQHNLKLQNYLKIDNLKHHIQQHKQNQAIAINKRDDFFQLALERQTNYLFSSQFFYRDSKLFSLYLTIEDPGSNDLLQIDLQLGIVQQLPTGKIGIDNREHGLVHIKGSKLHYWDQKGKIQATGQIKNGKIEFDLDFMKAAKEPGKREWIIKTSFQQTAEKKPKLIKIEREQKFISRNQNFLIIIMKTRVDKNLNVSFKKLPR